MENKQLKRSIQEYRLLELEAHVELDDVINKVTQEVSELVEAIMEGNLTEMKKEAADSIVNILSASYAMGAEVENFRGKFQKIGIMNDFGHLFVDLGKWNQQIQALRGRYSRDIGCVDCLQKATYSLINNVLSYVDDDKTLHDIVVSNYEKFKSRTETYKEKIDLKEYVGCHKGFPVEGIEFRDISPLLGTPEAMRYACFELARICNGADVIAGLDARGFIFGQAVADILGKPFVMIRKKGKLPGDTISCSYSLEYGKNEIEVQEACLKEGQKVAILDDLLATGGTLEAAAELIQKAGGEVSVMACLISLEDKELVESQSRKNLERYNLKSVISY